MPLRCISRKVIGFSGEKDQRITQSGWKRRICVNAALWSSGFRPFFLCGAIYGPLLAALWYGERLDWWILPASSAVSPLLVHAHEFVFGFACAIVCGVLLTALPGWARPEGASTAHDAGAAMGCRPRRFLSDRLRVIVILADCALFRCWARCWCRR
jgi:uncharacterized protein involved in response to NO